VNSNGCDSVITLDLSINNSAFGQIFDTACDSYTWNLNGQSFTTSGSYTDTIQTVFGCDSFVTLNLTLLYTTSVTQTFTACDSFTWSATGLRYYQSGQYPDTVLSSYGCDSINILDLTILNSSYETIFDTACIGFTWPLTGLTYSATGRYFDTITNSVGCDSVVRLDLTIYSPSFDTIQVTACESYSWPVSGQTYSASGLYTDTLVNSRGCDSIITLDLSINFSAFGRIYDTACDSYTWGLNGQTFTASGSCRDTIQTVQACDSFITLELTILRSTAGQQVVTACDNYTWPANGQAYTSSGNYQTVLTNAQGCDSTIFMALTINQSNGSTQNQSACEQYIWPTTGWLLTNSGTYRDTLTNRWGCDSVVTLNLTILRNSTGNQQASACDSFTWTVNGQTYFNSGTYRDTLSNAAGCDSFLTLNLTINSARFAIQNQTACDLYTWPVNGQTYNQSGQYRAITTASNGCDSVIDLNLTVNYTSSRQWVESNCQNYTWPANGQTYSQSGLYQSVLTNSSGCDSILILNLSIDNALPGRFITKAVSISALTALPEAVTAL
jgi:hypothetical protein